LNPGRSALLLGALCWAGACHAGLPGWCVPPQPAGAAQQDRLLRFSALIKSALDESGQPLALVSRNGIDLSRFDERHSHAGLSLRESPNGPWSVRQLYYACDEQRPRIFDQGVAGFLLGTGDQPATYVSVVLLPPERAEPLQRAAADNRLALALLAPVYSANAYPFSLAYQNCNQWVMELLASAWGNTTEAADPRAAAQRWMAQQNYLPHVFEVGWTPLMWAAASIKGLHVDDHPAADLDARLFRVSMPSSIEAFVRTRVAGAQRLEFCLLGSRVVVHRGWDPIAEGCTAGRDDHVVEFGD
jgi:hypothetical protein